MLLLLLMASHFVYIERIALWIFSSSSLLAIVWIEIYKNKIKYRIWRRGKAKWKQMAVDAHVNDEEKTINIHSHCVCILLNQMRPFIEIIIPWILWDAVWYTVRFTARRHGFEVKIY